MTDERAARFIEYVLALRPRIAVFDCDGTLWDGDSGAEFFYWELDRGLFPKPVAERIRPRYDAYLKGKISEEAMCGEMVTIHAGIAEEKIVAAAAEFFRHYMEPHIFPEMMELTHSLARAECELWAVSSTNVWVIREGVRRFGIPAERVLAASVEIQRGYATGRLTAVPTGPGKAEAVRTKVANQVDVVFGNSIHDLEMLELARHPLAVNPTPELAPIAAERKWQVYVPASCVRCGSRATF
jgi:phosphoserine phosphatase